MRRCSKITIQGKVQGVSFREFVQKKAEKFNIEGTVQNSHNDIVIINACGMAENIDDFIDALYSGPPKSKVEKISEEPLSNKPEFRGVFRIIGQ